MKSCRNRKITIAITLTCLSLILGLYLNITVTPKIVDYQCKNWSGDSNYTVFFKKDMPLYGQLGFPGPDYSNSKKPTNNFYYKCGESACAPTTLSIVLDTLIKGGARINPLDKKKKVFKEKNK